jgi:signal transduction histidine kinase
MRWRDSIATRLALGYGLLLVASVTLVSGVFFYATIGVMEDSMNNQIVSLSRRLADTYRERPLAELVEDIEQQLEDGMDSDAEIFLVLSASGESLAGNLPRWQGRTTPLDELLTDTLPRSGEPSEVRYMLTELGDERLLLVGYDMQEQEEIRVLVLRALITGALTALLLVALGATFFRRQIERRIGEIRRAAQEIEQGNLHRRIPIAGDDEFERLSIDINRMLDRIQQLMEGVRHVSNSIAHDLRTPLSRIRNRLEDAMRTGLPKDQLRYVIGEATEGIDELLILFNKLLQIAEAESGMRASFSEHVDIATLVRDLYELYDASAEESGVTLSMDEPELLVVQGDRDLLASAVASLIDNALKYAGTGSRVSLKVEASGQQVCISVSDNGPGIEAAELPKVVQRFYRLDQSRSKPGNGLGLAIVQAIATLHGGSLLLENLQPGLRASLLLPLGKPGASGHLSNL